MRSSELSIGSIPPTDAEDIVQQRGYGYPVFFFRHAEGSNLLANAFDNAHHRRLPRGTCERRANPRMLIDGVEHGQREEADSCLRRRAGRNRSQGRVHGASDDGVACSGQQIALVSDVPVNSTRAGSEPFR